MLEQIKPSEWNDNLFRVISKEWMLLGAGNSDGYNMMTASWGEMGHLWNRDVCTVFIRPQRYTYTFFEQEANFSVSLFGEEHRDVLQFCGAHSGRDCNKAAEAGLTPIFQNGTVLFAQARLSLVCRKIYVADLTPQNFVDLSLISKYYPQKDFHRCYVGEIEAIFRSC